MKLKIVTLLIFIAIIILPISTYAITEQDNGKMKVSPVTTSNFEGGWIKGFDIKGYITNDREIISSTHNNLGYHVFLNVDGKHGEMSGKNTLSKDQMESMHYTQVRNDTIQNIDGIDLLVKTKFINNGNQVQIIYTLKNTTENQLTFSLGTSSDVEIDGDDRATIEKIHNGEEVRLWTENGTTQKKAQFVFYGKNTQGVTNIDNLWIGYWNDYYLQHIFDTNPNTKKIENDDSAFTFSWVNRTIKAGETQNYSVLIEVGDLNVPNIEIMLENNAILYYKDVIINGIVHDKDLKDVITIHYNIDGTEYTLSPITTTGQAKNFSIDLTKLNLTETTPHILKVWATDSTNYQSNIEEKTFTITNLKNPQLILTEKNWTKNDVIFKIIDIENDKQYVNKYQYRINNEEWIDTQKDIQHTIQESGITQIDIRIEGTKGDYSEVITDYAKIDKIKPDTTAPTAIKTTNSITVNLKQTDKESGIDNKKTVYTIKKENQWSEWQTSNIFTDLINDTEYIIKTKITDNAGNTAESEELNIKTNKIEKEEPDKPEEKPDKPEEKPDKPEEKPDKPEEEPDKPEEKPDKPEEEPDKPEEKPDKPEEKPDNPEEEPDKPKEEPDKPKEELDKPKEELDKPEGEPNKEQNDDTVANIKIPKTGENYVIPTIISILAIRATIYYLKIKKIKKL